MFKAWIMSVESHGPRRAVTLHTCATCSTAWPTMPTTGTGPRASRCIEYVERVSLRFATPRRSSSCAAGSASLEDAREAATPSRARSALAWRGKVSRHKLE